MKAIIFDTETTGLENPALVEAAYIEQGNSPRDLRSGAQVFCGRFNPGKPIEHGASAVHHILDCDVVGAPSPGTFSLPDGTRHLIGHNVDFDWKVIGCPDVRRICTLAICRKLFPDAGSHTLGAMMYMLFGESARDKVKGAHSALADCDMNMILLEELVARIPVNHTESWDALWSYSEAARVPEVMPFGKHKGMPIQSVPSDYRRWLLVQPDVDPYLAKALRG